jgi:hypothetical protein
LSMALPSVTWCSIGYSVLSVKQQFLNCFSSNSSCFEWNWSVLCTVVRTHLIFVSERFVIAICDFLSLVFVASATLSFGTCKTASLNCFLQTLHLFNWNLSTCRLCVLSFPSFSEGCLTVLIWSFSLKILSLWFVICSKAKINLIENLWDF